MAYLLATKVGRLALIAQVKGEGIDGVLGRILLRSGIILHALHVQPLLFTIKTSWPSRISKSVHAWPLVCVCSRVMNRVCACGRYLDSHLGKILLQLEERLEVRRKERVRQSFIAQRAVEEGKGDHRRGPARFQLLQQTVQMEDVPTRLCTYAIAARTTSVQVCSMVQC